MKTSNPYEVLSNMEDMEANNIENGQISKQVKIPPISMSTEELNYNKLIIALRAVIKCFTKYGGKRLK